MTARVALVTGGTGGIGTAICKALAAKGHKVAASYLEGIDDAPAWLAQMKADGFEMEAVAGDVGDYDSCVSMVKAVEEKLGPVDILVNGAGITRDKMFKRMEKDHWSAVLKTNLDSVFNVTKQVTDGMVERGWGRVVNISSVNGQKGQAGQTNYSAAKAGMHGFTMALAQELANKGVTVNTVSPGYIATSMVMAIKQEVRDAIVATIPAGRFGTPEEIAWAVEFLSDDKSGFMTGANLAMNGGLHMGP